jgi:hypothetical protein
VAEGANRYEFARSNPYANTDRLGLAATPQPAHGSGFEVSWKGGLLAMGGALWSFLNIFAEAGKQLYDLGGLSVQAIGDASGWWRYEHEVASGIGKMAQEGKGTWDITKAMGKNIMETPGRVWDAAERGDYVAFGAESLNFYMLGRSTYGVAKGSVQFAFNRGVGALPRLGPRGVAARNWVRVRQVARLGRIAERITSKSAPGNVQVPRGVPVRYGGLKPGYFGEYDAATNTITIYEDTFTPSLDYRLPSLSPGDPYFVLKPLVVLC